MASIDLSVTSSHQGDHRPDLPTISTRPLCPSRARSNGNSERFTVTHGQARKSLTCVNAGHLPRTRSLPSWSCGFDSRRPLSCFHRRWKAFFESWFAGCLGRRWPVVPHTCHEDPWLMRPSLRVPVRPPSPPRPCEPRGRTCPEPWLSPDRGHEWRAGRSSPHGRWSARASPSAL
jgi:hypothetical protein